MRSKTNEAALEISIQTTLTGTSLEAQKEGNEAIIMPNSGYQLGYAKDFDAHFAIDTRFFWEFLERSQPKELEKLKTSANWQRKILERFDRIMKQSGILRILREGLTVENAHLRFHYPVPLASSAKAVHEDYQHNIFSVTRQVSYSLLNAREEIDLVLFINGIPFATVELKNAWTHQTARYHGIRQYEERDQNQPLLSFGRALVHMTVDTDEVFMTTHLKGKKTFFLPFNRGNNGGAGNPINPNGHKTAYLWEDVFAKESVSDLIQHFAFLEGKKASDPLNQKKLLFPRFQQLDVVRSLLSDVEKRGLGNTYLIQHSAGSGKSNSITWLAFQLIDLYSKREQGNVMDIPKPIVDTVIVVTDRRILDRQLRDNIKNFSQVGNIIEHAESAQDLRRALENKKRIVITTIQKFPFIIDGIEDLSEHNFAVIIDEAHSSQSGRAHDTMNEAMGRSGDLDAENLDADDRILKAMAARKLRNNASYFAFTATPKNSTLEKFGEMQEDGSFVPFHLYSMKQAIEEGFILDVLSNYTTYKSYYEIQKSIEDNPHFDTKKAQKKLKAYVESHKATIAAKAEVMLDHFITNVYGRKRLKGQAKGMVLTQNIEAAIRYYQALRDLLDERGNPFKIIIAFSGTKIVDGIEYTENSLNGFADSKTRDKFDEDEYRLLVVANKYLTGFDQPKLTVMYIDKRLNGVIAVQGLSRLNRSAPQLGKRTEDLFILDFYNTIEDMKASFEPFYTSTSLSKATDINILHDLQYELDRAEIYYDEEIDEFNQRYFSGAKADGLSPIIDAVAMRFNHSLELEELTKVDYKIKMKQFVKIYGQMASIMPFESMEWEKRFWFYKFLIPKMIIADPEANEIDALLDSVDLSTYALERVHLNEAITLDEGEGELSPQNPNPRGVHEEDEERSELSEIVEYFNDHYFRAWEATPEEKREKLIQIADDIRNHPDFKTRYDDNPDPFTRELALTDILKDITNKNYRKEHQLYRLIHNELTTVQKQIERLL